MEAALGTQGISISKCYTLLCDTMEDDLAKHMDRWQDKVQAETGVCEDSLLLSSTAAISANIQVQCFKTWLNLYITPSRIFKWGGSTGIYCPRCGELAADSVHLFATCPRLTELIGKMAFYVKQILDHDLMLSPQVILLGVSNQALAAPRKTLLFIMMAIFRLSIATGWLDKDPPSVLRWLEKLLATYRWEKEI